MSADLIAFDPAARNGRSSARDASVMLFDPDWYRTEYPDVAICGIDPVFHYFSNGAGEGRNPNPFFNTRWYTLKYPDVESSGMNPFMHFMLYGFREGRLHREGEVAAPHRAAVKSKRAADNRTSAQGGL